MIDVPTSEAGETTAHSGDHFTVNGRAVRTTVRWVVGFVVVAHGLIHVLGAAKGLGWAEVTRLAAPISTAMGVVWLTAAVVTTAAGVLLIVRVRWWWIVGTTAVITSQAAIISSWSDAKAGTIANAVLLVGVIYGWASQGPNGAAATYRRRASDVLAGHISGDLVTEADLARLPHSVAAYVRRAGAVGEPKVMTLRARFHGRIRENPAKPWMTFTGEQVNSFGPRPSRLFFMDAELFGLPVEVLHEFEAGAATMRVRACSMFTMVDASGPEMDRAETVTVFNDMCILAPAALVDAPVTWDVIDECRVRGTYTSGVNTIVAELTFNDDDELLGFFSDDRTAVSTDGKSFTPRRWSTPLSGHRDVGPWHLGTTGEGRWRAPDGEFAYLEYNLDGITYNAKDLNERLTDSR